jgi:hypothetical protein
MAPAPSPSSNAVAMAAPPPPKPAIAMNFGVRVGLKLQDPEQPKKMSQVHLDTTYAEARFHGDLTDYMGWTANFNVDALAGDTSDGTQASVAIMDMIARFHPSDYFNIWAGRLLVPSDRSNFSGPFFILPWNYPGFYAAGKPPLGPIDGPTGRDYGGTLWGMAIDQKLKYFVGAYGLDPAASAYHTYYSARVAYSFQGSEPGYFNQSTYYGGASVVTLGLGGQYKPKGAIDTTTGAPKDTFLFMADLLAEEATDVGTFTLEGQFYKFDDGYSFAPGYVTGATPTLLMAQNGLSKGPEEGFYVLGAYLFPEAIGPGKFQPLIRVQQTIDPSWTIVDAQLQYVIKPYNLRILLNYQHEDMNGTASNKLQFGTSLQM